MNDSPNLLTSTEESFLRALLWEEGHLQRGPATQAAEERRLSLIRCLEAANRLSPNLQGEALNRIREDACPTTGWPWGERDGEEVLRLLWSRLAQSGARPWSGDQVATADPATRQGSELHHL